VTTVGGGTLGGGADGCDFITGVALGGFILMAGMGPGGIHFETKRCFSASDKTSGDGGGCAAGAVRAGAFATGALAVVSFFFFFLIGVGSSSFK
jgi:hypothetical protein